MIVRYAMSGARRGAEHPRGAAGDAQALLQRWMDLAGLSRPVVELRRTADFDPRRMQTLPDQFPPAPFTEDQHLVGEVSTLKDVAGYVSMHQHRGGNVARPRNQGSRAPL